MGDTVKPFVAAFEIDRNALFDAIAAVGDGGQDLGIRIAGILLAGEQSFFDAVGLAAYGITFLPTPQVPA